METCISRDVPITGVCAPDHAPTVYHLAVLQAIQVVRYPRLTITQT
jgi:hypothetical protein